MDLNNSVTHISDGRGFFQRLETSRVQFKQRRLRDEQAPFRHLVEPVELVYLAREQNARYLVRPLQVGHLRLVHSYTNDKRVH